MEFPSPCDITPPALSPSLAHAPSIPHSLPPFLLPSPASTNLVVPLGIEGLKDRELSGAVDATAQEGGERALYKGRREGGRREGGRVGEMSFRRKASIECSSLILYPKVCHILSDLQFQHLCTHYPLTSSHRSPCHCPYPKTPYSPILTLYKPGKPCVLSTVEKEDTIPGPFKKPSCACILVLMVSKGWPTATDWIGKGWKGRGVGWKGGLRKATTAGREEEPNYTRLTGEKWHSCVPFPLLRVYVWVGGDRSPPTGKQASLSAHSFNHFHFPLDSP